MKPPKPEPLCKVLMQYRRGAGKVFELESAGKMLDVCVTPRLESELGGAWRVAAQDRRGGDAVVIAESGATRSEALEKVSRAWTDQMLTSNLSAFDWTAITSTLLSIRAI